MLINKKKKEKNLIFLKRPRGRIGSVQNVLINVIPCIFYNNLINIQAKSFCNEGCSCNQTAIDCSSRSLDNYFFQSTIDLISLSLGSVTQTKQVKTLLLNNNQIKSIRLDWFTFFIGLEYLDLSQNQIELIDEYSFSTLKTLKILKLNNNLLVSINQNHLNGLDSLKELYLSNNLFQLFNDYAFVNLKNALIHLDVSLNRFQNVDKNSLSGLNNLNSLKLNDNLIEIIADESFSSLNSLKQLDISNNRLRIIKKNTFKGLNSAIEINLRSNQISEFDTSSFDFTPNLQILDLDDNQIGSSFITMDCSGIDIITQLNNIT